MLSDYEQKKTFIEGEANAWFERNSNLDISQRIDSDPVLNAIDSLGFLPKKVLEIGCAEGWRLNEINNRYGSDCYGFDPSKKAIEFGIKHYTSINLEVATADKIPHKSSAMDLVVVGFCLYVCDRNELFLIAKEIDRVLCDGGVLVVLDFYSEVPYKNRYIHKKGLYSYKMDYARMFTWNPDYQLLTKNILNHNLIDPVDEKDDRIAISILRKSVGDAYINNISANLYGC